MTPFGSLTHRGQVVRLRRVARAALDAYDIDRGARLTPLRHEHNTTFRVESARGRSLLRINRPGDDSVATVASEMAWLRALADHTDLGVPRPVASRDGSDVATAHDPGVPGERTCVLLDWQVGRFVPEGALRPHHLRRVGRLLIGLQEHAWAWAPPVGFRRWRVDTLTRAGRTASIAGTAADARHGVEHPTSQDAAIGRRMVSQALGAEGAAIFDRALAVVRRTTRMLDALPDGFGLIHGDLHQENYLFRDGRACAIDFDDCGWGYALYDLIVTLWELEEDDGFAGLRHALLDEYARHRSLPPEPERHLRALSALRRLQILFWVLESREHPTFRDRWERWARTELDGIAWVLGQTSRTAAVAGDLSRRR